MLVVGVGGLWRLCWLWELCWLCGLCWLWELCWLWGLCWLLELCWLCRLCWLWELWRLCWLWELWRLWGLCWLWALCSVLFTFYGAAERFCGVIKSKCLCVSRVEHLCISLFVFTGKMFVLKCTSCGSCAQPQAQPF